MLTDLLERLWALFKDLKASKPGDMLGLQGLEASQDGSDVSFHGGEVRGKDLRP